MALMSRSDGCIALSKGRSAFYIPEPVHLRSRFAGRGLHIPMLASLVWRLLALAGLLMGVPAHAQDDLANTYNIVASLDPADGAMDVSATIDIVADKRTKTIELLLNGTFDIASISASRDAEITIEHGIVFGTYEMPHTQRIAIALARPMERGDALRIATTYSGTITKDTIEMGRGIVSRRWTELSADALWYPVWYEEPDLRYDLALTLPPQYDVVGPGDFTRADNGVWQLSPRSIVNTRITFAASDSWTIVARPVGENLGGAVYTARSTPKINALLDGLESAVEAYRGALGEPKFRLETIKVIYPGPDINPTFPQQAYVAGRDFIVLDESDLPIQLDTLNHEVAHLWWSRGTAGTPDEFLSESIAEFLAKRQGGDVWGQAWLEERRGRMRTRSQALEASLLDIDGFTADRQALLYHRGPTMLFDLQDRIGRDAIDALLRDFLASEADTIQAFLQLLARRHGDSVEEWARGQL